MATRPKNTVNTTEGTLTHDILNYLVWENDVTFDSQTEAAQFLTDKLRNHVRPKKLSEVINWFNDGLYRVDGADVTTHGPIYLNEKPNTDPCYRGNKNSSGDSLKGPRSFDEIIASKGFDPKDVSEFWSKDKELSVRMKKASSDDELREWNDGIERAREVLGELISESNLKWEKPYVEETERIGVLNIADLHLGAEVKNVKDVPDYNSFVVREHLDTIAARINTLHYSGVYVNILGDLVDCFENLMHENQWKEMEYGIYGVNAIRLCSEILHEFLGKINNLEEVQIIAGNHDRNTKSRDSDVKGTAAGLVAYCLELMGYKVNFDSLYISKEIDGINYILLHGDKMISKRSTKELAWSKGKQGMFNFILEGHLHSRNQKASTNIVGDDASETRRQVIPSIFSGNTYSQQGNWDAHSGFIIIENSGNGRPNTFDFSL